MKNNLRTKSFSNKINKFLVIISLFALFLTGCQQITDIAKNATNTASNTNTNPESGLIPMEGYTGQTTKQELKNVSLPFAEGEDLTVEVANDGTVIFERDMILGNISDFTKSSSPAGAQLSSDPPAKKEPKSRIWSNSSRDVEPT